MNQNNKFNNIDFSNPATLPVILLASIACQNEESMKQFEKYLEEYKEKLKKGEIDYAGSRYQDL